MKSLSNLNTFSNTLIEFTDNRTTNIDIVQVNQTIINIEDSSLVFPAINAYEIYSISNAPAINVRLQLTVSSPFATVQWSNDPRFTIVQNGTIYTITGINSDADWNLIKNPIITLPAQFPGTFTYSFSITYNTASQANLVVNWSVNKKLVFSIFQSTFNLSVSPNEIYGVSAALTVPVIVNVNIQPITLGPAANSILYSSLTQNINTPILFETNATIGATWTIIMQTPITSISNVVATGYSAYTNYDSATGAFIITANKTLVNQIFDAIRVTTTSLNSNFDILYIASNNITADIYSVVQLVINGNLLTTDIQTSSSISCNAIKIRRAIDATIILNGNTNSSIGTTSSAKIGTGCAIIAGPLPAPYLRVSNAFNKLNFGTGDFTVEGWYNIQSTTYDVILFGSDPVGNYFNFRRYTDNSIRVGRAPNVWDAITAPNLGFAFSWNHLAVSRNNGFMRIFVNGTQYYSGNNTINYTMSGPVYMGKRPNEGSFIGSIDEVRISNTARYTGNFTPSTVPFVNDENTIMLLHLDTATNNISPDDIS